MDINHQNNLIIAQPLPKYFLKSLYNWRIDANVPCLHFKEVNCLRSAAPYKKQNNESYQR